MASSLGIIATAGFQVVASHGLGPRDFGLLTAFLAFINIAAVGSAALRNAVAVDVAADDQRATAPRFKKLDSSAVEALVLGALFTAGLVVASPWLTSSLQSSASAPLIAAATVLPYFLFARALGILQGKRRTRAVVWLSTASQIVQFLLAIVVLAFGWGVTGVLWVYMFTVVAVTICAWRMTRGAGTGAQRRAFSKTSAVVLLLSITFAWLTSVDVILVRAGTPDLVSGAYSAGAVLVKLTLILPATLSLYLLPRFVSGRKNGALSRLGVNLTVGLTAIAGVAIALTLWLAGPLITGLLFGAAYDQTASLLPAMALSWIPWAMTQAILVRVTAVASIPGLIVLLVAAAAQWAGAKLLLPDLDAMIILNGVVGASAFAMLFVIHLWSSREAPGNALAGVAA